MSNSNRTYEEKRDFIRMTMNATASITLSDGKLLPVTCIDLSAGGMAIKSNQSVAVGEKVHVVIGSPNQLFSSMDADGTVLRCQELSNSDYELGIEIEEIS